MTMTPDPPGPGETFPPTDPRAISLLTTEHFALQGLRASTISDSSSRAGLFMASISGTLVALSLLGNATHLGPLFVVSALVIAPTLIFLGVATYARVLQSSIEDIFYGLGINRVRHLYLELVPEYRPYFIQSDRDDTGGVLANMGASRGGVWQMLLTTAGSIGVINSVLIGAYGAGLLMALLKLSVPQALVSALLFFLTAVVLHSVHQQRVWSAFSRGHPALFPSPPDATVSPRPPR